MNSMNRLLWIVPVVGLLAGCEAGSGDTEDATTNDAATSGETGAPTTGAAGTDGTEAGGLTEETGVAPTAGETGGADTSDGTGETTVDEGVSDDGTTDENTTDGETTGEPAVEPEIAGMYTDEYGSMHTIDAETWTLDTSVFHVLSVDNDTDHLIAENDAVNDFFPGLFSRFDWHVEGADVFYCQTAYDAASQADAEATEPADGDDLVMGCGGFPWTLLTP